MLDKESSSRLNLLRFPLIVGVVFIHSYQTTINTTDGVIGESQNGFYGEFVRNFISQELARTAVPLFFLMSGYLFFLGFQFSKEGYFEKLKGRTRSLLVPYLFWNILTLIIIGLAQSIPEAQVFFSGKNIAIASFGLKEYIVSIFGIGKYPIAYQFWFVRDLMVLAILTPITYYLIKNYARLFIVILFSWWILSIWPASVPSAEAMLFFSVGSYAAVHRKSLFFLDKHGVVLSVIYVASIAFTATFPHINIYGYLHKICILLGLPVILYLTKLTAKTNALKLAILSLSEASFFVYAAHEPLLTITRKLLFKTIHPESELVALILYFSIPTFIIVVLVLVYRRLLSLYPVFMKIIAGENRKKLAHPQKPSLEGKSL